MSNDNSTVPTDDSIEAFLAGVADPKRQADSRDLLLIMRQATGVEPVMWGSAIIGFGSYHYKYASGREGDSMRVGFSPRKEALVLYGLMYHEDNIATVEKLGPHKLGKGCLYIKDLAVIDMPVLSAMITHAFSQPNPAESQ